MAQIKQVGIGRKSTGTIDGITYYVRGGITYARSTPNMPATAYNTPEAKLRQAIWKMIQMHARFHLHTIRQTISSKGNGSPSNQYISLNYKAFAKALETLAEQYCAGENVTIDDIEAAISAYAAEHPKAITIGHLSGYQDVWLSGPWPESITLSAYGGDSTMIIIVAENGTTTTYNTDGTVVVSSSNNSGSAESADSGNNGNTGGNTSDSEDPSTEPGQAVTVNEPTISGETQFTGSTQVTMSAESGAEIRYTVDESTPTASSTLYSAPITLTETTVVKAIAIKDGVSSSVTSSTFTKSSGGSSGED